MFFNPTVLMENMYYKKTEEVLLNLYQTKDSRQLFRNFIVKWAATIYREFDNQCRMVANELL